MNDYSNELGLRFRGRYDELRQLFTELYGDDRRGFRYLCSVIKQFYTERSDALRIRDRAHEKVPGGRLDHRIVGMTAYAGRPGDIAQRIDYLVECGVQYILLSTTIRQAKEPETVRELRELASLCQSRGIMLGAGFEMNHTDSRHPWALAARAGDATARGFYHYFADWDIPHAYERTLYEGDEGCFTQPEGGGIVMTMLGPDRWDLNYANPMVFSYVAAELLSLANSGADVIRLESVPFIWKEIGTTCRNLPQVHSIVRMLRIIFEVVCPSVMLLGETEAGLVKSASYFGTSDRPEFHMLSDTELMPNIWNALATRDVRLLTHAVDQLAKLPQSDLFLYSLRCDEGIGWTLDYRLLSEYGMQKAPHIKFLNDYYTGRFPQSPARGELSDAEDKRVCGTTASLCGVEAALWDKDDEALRLAVDADIMLHAFLMTQSGMIALCSGDEIGRINDYRYHADIKKKFDTRWLHRGEADSQFVGRHTDHDTFQGRIFSALKHMEQLRASNEVFCRQAELSVFDTGSQNVLCLIRRYRGQEMTALFNFCEQERSVDFEKTLSGTDLMTGKAYRGKRIVLQPYGFIWIKRKHLLS